MKKIIYTIVAIAAIASFSSCKKCGYCAYGNGQGNSSSTCKQTSVIGSLIDDYDQAKSDCTAQGGTWVVTN